MGFNRLYIPTLDSLKKTMKIAGKKKYLKMAAKQDAFFGDPEAMSWLLDKLKKMKNEK